MLRKKSAMEEDRGGGSLYESINSLDDIREHDRKRVPDTPGVQKIALNPFVYIRRYFYCLKPFEKMSLPRETKIP